MPLLTASLCLMDLYWFLMKALPTLYIMLKESGLALSSSLVWWHKYKANPWRENHKPLPVSQVGHFSLNGNYPLKNWKIKKNEFLSLSVRQTWSHAVHAFYSHSNSSGGRCINDGNSSKHGCLSSSIFADPNPVSDLTLNATANTINVTWKNPEGGHQNFSVTLDDPDKEVENKMPPNVCHIYVPVTIANPKTNYKNKKNNVISDIM